MYVFGDSQTVTVTTVDEELLTNNRAASQTHILRHVFLEREIDLLTLIGLYLGQN